MKRVLCLIITAVLLVSCLASCKKDTDLSSTDEESRTVLTVDGYDVPYEMLRYAVMMHLYETASAAVGEADEDTELYSVINTYLETLDPAGKEAAFEEAYENSVTTLKKIYSLWSLAAEVGVDPDGEMIATMVDAEMENIRAGYKNDADYKKKIGRFFMNDSVYTVLTKYEVLFEEVYEVSLSEKKIPSDDESILRYLLGDDTVRVKQILISFERHSETEAEAMARDVHTLLEGKLNSDGTVDQDYFDTLTDSMGEDLFMFKNRDGYYMPRGYDDRAFEAAAFATPVGGLSDVTRVNAGYTVLTRVEKDEDYIKANLSTLRDAVISGQYLIMTDTAAEDAVCEEKDVPTVFSIITEYIPAEK